MKVLKFSNIPLFGLAEEEEDWWRRGKRCLGGGGAGDPFEKEDTVALMKRRTR